jgi:ribosome-associated heat shock protein Hsp15
LPASDKTGVAADTRQRIDKWLWFARVVKTREAAAALVEDGHVRINGIKVLKPGHDVKPGDVLTIVLHTRVRVLHIEGLAPRRGPAEAARHLYREPAMSSGVGQTPQKEGA